MNYNFTAISYAAKIVFSIRTNNKQTWYLDDVSVTHANNENVSLLVNGNFNLGNFIGWNFQSCTTSCSVNPGIFNSSDCYQGACFVVPEDCENYQLIQQFFLTTIGQIYKVSFRIKCAGSGGSNEVDIKVAIVNGWWLSLLFRFRVQ